MEKRDRGKEITIALTTLILNFYTVIVEYVLFAIIKTDGCQNFLAGMIFETIGILLLFTVVLGNLLRKYNIKVGYYAPIILCTILYTIILNCLNFIGILSMSSMMFFLAHMILLFVFFVLIIPMYIMGKKQYGGSKDE